MRTETSGSGTLRKHRLVYSSLSRDIHSGRWKRGERLPSEAQLVERFRVSRITIGRAVRDLQAAGLVERRGRAGALPDRRRPRPNPATTKTPYTASFFKKKQ